MNTRMICIHVVCMAMVVSTALTQEACLPPTIPENAVDCTVPDSDFLSCACTAYKLSILEILSSLTCLIPGFSVEVPTSTTTTTTPALPTTTTTTTTTRPTTTTTTTRPTTTTTTTRPTTTTTTTTTTRPKTTTPPTTTIPIPTTPIPTTPIPTTPIPTTPIPTTFPPTTMPPVPTTTIRRKTTPPPTTTIIMALTRTTLAPVAVTNSSTTDLIINVIQTIGRDVFDKLCAQIHLLETCVSTSLKDSNKTVDTALKNFFQMDKLGSVLSQLCGLRTEIWNNFDCLSQASASIGLCVTLATSDQQWPLPPWSYDPPDALNLYCPVLGDIVRCTSIQINACSETTGSSIRSMANDFLSTSCITLGTEGNKNPLMSTGTMCGLSTAPQLLAGIESFGQQEPTSAQLQEFISTAIDLECEALPQYLKCIQNELPSSRNPIDLFLNAFVDINQFTYWDAIAKHICDPGRVQDIKSVIECITNKTDVMVNCSSQHLASFNVSAVGNSPATDRNNYCGRIRDLSMCFIDDVLHPCKAEVAEFARDMYFWLMRTDCYGARNGTFQSVIANQQRLNNTNSAPVKHDLPSVFTFILGFLCLLCVYL